MVGPTYTILTPEELARLRVDMYVGALSPPAASEQKKTLHVGTDGAIWGAAQRLADALEHIITEVVVNCADQISLGRSRRAELYIDRDTGLIRVWNDGRIPIEKHPQRPGLYNAEVIYGLMNSSSNYSDATKAKNNQFTGGRNGIGAKAANILSSRFVVSCTDAELGLDLVATWRNGMTIADGAVVKTTRPKRKTSSVCVEFIPDYARLGCELPLSDAAVSSLAMRFVECAATCVVRGARFVMDLPIISSNGVQLGEAIDVVVPCVASNKRALMSSSTMPRKRKKMAPTCAGGPSRDEEEDGDDNGVPVANPTRRTLECRPNFKKMATALMATDPSTVFHDIVGKTLFEVVVAMENDSSMGMYDFGYVNSVRCFSGTHIAYAKGCIANALLGEPNIKKALGPNTPTGAITRHFRVGVRCLIQNPSFSSQTKDKLVTPFSKFGFTWSVPPHIVKKLKDHVLEGAKAVQDAKDARAANKQIKGPSAPGGGRDFVNVPKLDDALLAPFPSKRGNCSLYITEGDSPKAFVMAGLSEIGRERNGVMPIRGKLRNVRDLTVKSIMACQEVVNVLKALGLTPGQNVTDLKQLRYQKFVILTDQDDDGHHIAGLLANMIDVVAPKLLERFPLFISRFVTPLVKATKQGAVKTFYDTQSFDAWSSRNPSGWTIRFLKGLGSSSTAEAKEYFRNIDQHMCPFTFASAAAHGALEIAFGKDVPGRKKWMMETSDAPPCDYVGQRPLPFETFCNTSLAAYSQSSLIRGIPSLVDGCCEASRKLIFGLEKLGVTKSERVSQLVGKLIGISAYHHGDASLTETLVRMAQTYVGGANVALLVPDGQFGSRIDEKKKHAAARYIATYLNPIVDSIFRPEDRALLTHNVDDGKQVEPHFFLPVTCYGLFNDTSGICTGWSTNIPAYNPRDVINYTRAVINGEEVSLPALTPWYVCLPLPRHLNCVYTRNCRDHKEG